ncbi:hypothetical protein A2U01_0109346, partial [Trifolium medium]|nr:hypothetical protein [Trifolium medium]
PLPLPLHLPRAQAPIHLPIRVQPPIRVRPHAELQAQAHIHLEAHVELHPMWLMQQLLSP